MDTDFLLRLVKESLKLDEEPTIEDSMETIEKWDSLSHLNLIMDIEKATGIRFPIDRVPDLTSIELIEKELFRE